MLSISGSRKNLRVALMIALMAVMLTTAYAEVADTIAPQITIADADHIWIESGEGYSADCYEAIDDRLGDITQRVIVTYQNMDDVNANVDSLAAGTPDGHYKVIYTVEDSLHDDGTGNRTTVAQHVYIGYSPSVPYISISNMSGYLGDTVKATVTLHNAAGLTGAQYAITYDESSLIINNIKSLTPEANWDNQAHDFGYPVIAVAQSGFNSQRSVDLLEMTCEIKDTAQTGEAISPINFEHRSLVTNGSMDAMMQAGQPSILTVRVNEAPQITLKGDNPLTLEAGHSYNEPGYVITDDRTANCTLNIIGQDLNTLLVGPHVVTYRVEDAAGLQTSVERIVNVVDTTAPVITLSGDARVTIEYGHTFTDDGNTSATDLGQEVNVVVNNPVTAQSKPGTYRVAYTATDDAGNSAVTYREVVIVDNTAPVITLTGGNMTLNAGDVFNEPGYSVNEAGVEVIVGGDIVQTDIPGEYLITYNAKDAYGNVAVQKTRTVTVEDNTAPVITLVGGNVTIEAGQQRYIELGYVATDNVDGDITSQVTVAGDVVDYMTPGAYELTYNVTDSNGNSATTVARTVTVRDTTAPQIIILGDNPYYLEYSRGITFIDPGTTVIDIIDQTVVVNAGSLGNPTIGAHTITYTATDDYGNTSTQSRTVIVRDTTSPLIALKGATTVDLKVGDTYTEAGVIVSDNYDAVGDITITTTGSVATDEVGIYTLTYQARDTKGNISQRLERKVVVRDAASPVITLSGLETIYVEYGSTYVEPGFTAEDNVSGDLTNDVHTTGSVDHTTLGTYQISYDVSDAQGNAAITKVRTVIVQDTTAPTIEVIGDLSYTVEMGESFSMPSYSATDAYEGDMTSDVLVSGAVDVNRVGNYQLTYNVSDSSGNTADEVIVEVMVEDTTPPTIPNIAVSTTELTNQDITVTISGDEGSTLEYKRGDNQWTVYSTPLTLSKNTTILARATDAANNTSETASYVVTNIDKDKPQIIAAYSQKIGTTSRLGNVIDLHMLINDANEVNAYFEIIDDQGQTILGQTLMSYQFYQHLGSYTVGNLGDTTITVKLWAVDSAGNSTAETTMNFAVDTAAPTIDNVTVNHVDSPFKAGETVEVTITAEADARVTVDIGNLAEDIDALFDPNDGKYHAEWHVEQGKNGSDLAIKAEAQDLVGNNNSAFSDTLITVDTEAPISSHELTPEVPDGDNGIYITTPVLTVSTGDANDTVYINGQIQPNNMLTLQEGLNTVSFYAKDLAENTEVVQTLENIWVDTIAPMVSIDLVYSDGIAGRHTATIEGTSESGALIEVYKVLGDGSKAHVSEANLFADENGKYVVEGVLLHEGQNNFEAYAFDQAGNQSTVATKVYTYDTKGPIFTISLDEVTAEVTIEANEAILGDMPQVDLTIGGQSFTLNLTKQAEANIWKGVLPSSGNIDIVVAGDDIYGNHGTGIYNTSMVIASVGQTVTTNGVVISFSVMDYFTINNNQVGNMQFRMGDTGENSDQLTAKGNNLVKSVQFRPDGTEFPEPVRITMNYDENLDPEKLIIIYFNPNTLKYEDLSESIVAVDTVNHTVTFETTHFSEHGVGADVTPPAVQVAQPVNGQYVNTSTITVTGSTNEDAELKFELDGAVVATKSVTAGAFSQVITLSANAQNDLIVRATDAHNNTATTNVIKVTQDNTDPTLVVTSPTNKTVVKTDTIIFTGQVTDSNLDQLTINGKIVAVNADGSYSQVVSLTNAANAITLTASDKAGNITTESLTIYKDQVCAIDSVSSAANTTSADDTVITVAIAGSESAHVTVENLSTGIQEAVDCNGTAAVAIDLREGENNLRVQAVDELGNKSVYHYLDVTRSSAVAEISITLPEEGRVTADSLIDVVGQITSDSDLKAVTYTAVSMDEAGNETQYSDGLVECDGNGNFAIADLNIVEGRNKITITAVNIGGTANSSVNINRDTTGPEISVTEPTATSTSETSVIVSGYLNEAGTVTVYGNNKQVGWFNTVLGNDGKYHFSCDVGLTFNSDNTIRIEAEDTLTNTSSEEFEIRCTYKPKTTSGGSSSGALPVAADNIVDAGDMRKKTSTTEQDNTVFETTTYSMFTSRWAAAVNQATGKGTAMVIDQRDIEQASATQTDGKTNIEVVAFNLSAGQVKDVATLGLDYYAPSGAQLHLPATVMKALYDSDQALTIESYPLTAEVAQAKLSEDQTAVEGYEVNANATGFMTLRFPVPAGKLGSDLYIDVTHSDGSEETIIPNIVSNLGGKQFLEFTVKSFSTFIICEGEAPVTPEVPTSAKMTLTIGSAEMTIDGVAKTLDTAPYIDSDANRTLVPVRFVAEALGAEVTWLGNTRQVYIEYNGTVILLTIDSMDVLVNGEVQTIDCAATITDNRTFVPLRFVSETLGANVQYLPETKSIVIEK